MHQNFQDKLSTTPVRFVSSWSWSPWCWSLLPILQRSITYVSHELHKKIWNPQFSLNLELNDWTNEAICHKHLFVLKFRPCFFSLLTIVTLIIGSTETFKEKNNRIHLGFLLFWTMEAKSSTWEFAVVIPSVNFGK